MAGAAIQCLSPQIPGFTLGVVMERSPPPVSPEAASSLAAWASYFSDAVFGPPVFSEHVLRIRTTGVHVRSHESLVASGWDPAQKTVNLPVRLNVQLFTALPNAVWASLIEYFARLVSGGFS